MAITKVSRGLLNTGISDSSNATAITITSDENVLIGTTSGSDPLVVSDSGASSVTARLVNTNADANPANLRLQKLSGSPADGDYIGMINVSGENDVSEETIFQSIDFISTDVSDGTEDGDIVFRTRGAGTLAERMRITHDGDLKFNSGFGSAGTAYGVRAWVRFRGDTSGTGNRQVNGSGNVSSVGYIAAGRYRVNFSNNMPDVYYAVSATAIGVSNHNPQSASIDINNSNSVSYIDVAYGPSGGASSVSIANDSGAEYNAIIVR